MLYDTTVKLGFHSITWSIVNNSQTTRMQLTRNIILIIEVLKTFLALQQFVANKEKGSFGWKSSSNLFLSVHYLTPSWEMQTEGVGGQATGKFDVKVLFLISVVSYRIKILAQKSEGLDESKKKVCFFWKNIAFVLHCF